MDGAALRAIRTLFEGGPPTDGALLARFVERDGPIAEDAFAALVDRHGPMVLRVCRRILLNDEHAAHDALQATFLVLAGRARSLNVRDSLAPWLHAVARRVAGSARAAAARRRRHERRFAERAVAVAAPIDTDDQTSIIRDEVDRLPRAYRAAVTLCDLDGLSHVEAARALGWPIGTLKSRQARGRARLRDQLARRGVAPGLIAPALRPRCVADSLVRATVTSAAQFIENRTLAVVPAAVAALVRQEFRVMLIHRLAAFAGLGLAGTAVTLAVARPSDDPAAEPPRPVAAAAVASTPPRQAARPPAPTEIDAVPVAGGVTFAVRDDDGRLIDDEERLIQVRGLGDIHEYQTEVVPLSFVVVTGVFDHDEFRRELAEERGYDAESPRSIYRHVETQRQRLLPDTSWSPWEGIDLDAIASISRDIAFEEENRVPGGVLVDQLVEFVPFVTGEGIEKDRFRPARFLKEPPDEARGMVMGAAAQGTGMGAVVMRNGPGREAPIAPIIMLRAVDLTVEPGASYRYRLRVVTEDDRSQLAGRRELVGDWSEPTPAVTVSEPPPLPEDPDRAELEPDPDPR